ncbi:gluconate 2-dehydrogenase subunit 3 family protein [Seonamhaeicola sp. MEBiC1930]|uniref:gluconate 2-dehydrogenase subunit 3 family protein n=1 Tax=Seonamhaeicola sp. MEBiC01930 TaxID=2976768 RepID=UPI003255AF8D
MNRRDALKNLTIGLGYTVAAPTVLSILNSCSGKAETWSPLFLSELEKHIVTHLADIILPSSETPGAIDVNTPQFLDKMYYEMETKDKQKLFKSGSTLFSKIFKNTFNYEAIEGKKEDFEKLLDTYFKISEEESEKILKLQSLEIEEIPVEHTASYSIYKFLLSVKHYTLFGYFTSKEIGENVLAYDPIPGDYKGCISVEDATNGMAWSL